MEWLANAQKEGLFKEQGKLLNHINDRTNSSLHSAPRCTLKKWNREGRPAPSGPDGHDSAPIRRAPPGAWPVQMCLKQTARCSLSPFPAANFQPYHAQ